MGHSKGSLEREVHSDTGLSKKDRNISNKQPNPTATGTGGTITKTAQSKYKEGNNQDQSRINYIKTKSTILRINKSRSWFFEKINKIKKLLCRLIKKKRERAQINTIRNEREQITTDTTEIQRILRNYYELLYVKKFGNLGEMDTFLEKHNVPKLNEEEEERVKRSMTGDKIEAIIKNSQHTKALHQMVSQENFTNDVRMS